MLHRLLTTQRDNQLYLASVHYEGLRNYLDYVVDQKLGVVNADKESLDRSVPGKRGKKRKEPPPEALLENRA